jgi:hypothetical protein
MRISTVARDAWAVHACFEPALAAAVYGGTSSHVGRINELTCWRGSEN